MIFYLVHWMVVFSWKQLFGFPDFSFAVFFMQGLSRYARFGVAVYRAFSRPYRFGCGEVTYGFRIIGMKQKFRGLGNIIASACRCRRAPSQRSIRTPQLICTSSYIGAGCVRRTQCMIKLANAFCAYFACSMAFMCIKNAYSFAKSNKRSIFAPVKTKWVSPIRPAPCESSRA